MTNEKVLASGGSFTTPEEAGITYGKEIPKFLKTGLK